MPKLKSIWTFEQAHELVLSVQWQVRQFGFHLALGGGVLNRLVSMKDVDLYFIPLDDRPEPPNFEGLVAYLEGLWGSSFPITDPAYGPSLMYYDKKKFSYPEGKRIDVFITGKCEREKPNETGPEFELADIDA